MGSQQKIETTLHRALGVSKPPGMITQQSLDFGDRHLQRLARLTPGERADPDDLWNYAHDLLYEEIQVPLFCYLLPFCLEAWRDDLRGTSRAYGGFVEYFYLVLANRGVFSELLTPKQCSAVSEFIRGTILAEIDDQRGLSYQGMGARPYRWIGALTTYGVLLPDIGRLWTAWWSMDTIGRAIASMQYISCLMYPENENPAFAPWTPNGGGGPPCLWEFEGHLYEHRWLAPNVEFLRRTLNVHEITTALTRALNSLRNEPEHDIAARLREDLPLCADILESRCFELPQFLETTQDKVFEWSK
jgi:hypothetical protein